MKLTPEQDFIREVRAQLARRGMHQYDLAARLGCSPQTITRFLRDPGSTHVKTVQGIVRVLDPDPVIVLRWLTYTERRIIRINKQ